ncbi:MAG: hypothetical protein JSW39_23370 [Desulfobacterales bacterium]|nr:MAG: hypothetical protein JSW39_23370 [Desulfobacterales bacterium]
MTREEELVRQGWQKQAIYDEPRLTEMVALYRQIGFEVHLEPFNPDEEPGCTGCMQLAPENYRRIFTRKKSETD